eukprot:6383311-Amphidinium_carterae.2
MNYEAMLLRTTCATPIGGILFPTLLRSAICCDYGSTGTLFPLGMRAAVHFDTIWLAQGPHLETGPTMPYSQVRHNSKPLQPQCTTKLDHKVRWFWSYANDRWFTTEVRDVVDATFNCRCSSKMLQEAF